VSDAVADQFDSSNHLAGDNVLAVEGAPVQREQPDLTSAFASRKQPFTAKSGDLVLNEIAADNRARSNAGEHLTGLNCSITAANHRSGRHESTDDVLAPNKCVFPPNTLLAAQGYLTIWCDDEMNAPGLHTGLP
jgi:hypothetical protein